MVFVIHKSALPIKSNVISSHTILKLKVNENNSLYLKCRIYFHVNEDKIKNGLKSDWNMGSPSGERIIISIAPLKGWSVTKADVKVDFLQTGQGLRNIYVIHSIECLDR